jgi:hypothetical protein
MTNTHLKNQAPSTKHQNPNSVPPVPALPIIRAHLDFRVNYFVITGVHLMGLCMYHLTRSERGEGEEALEEALEASQDVANLGEEVEPEAGLFHGKVALACFNTLIKITPRVSISILIN